MSQETESVGSTVPAAAQFAELVLSVSRRLAVLDHQDEVAIPLSPLEAMLMRHIDADPGTTPSRISSRLGLKSSNTSAALRDLEGKGFVRREVDPADARGVRVYPTALARDNLALKRDHWAGVLEPHLADGHSLAVATAVLSGLDAALEGSSPAALAPAGGRDKKEA